jgi:hypothetical protein
MSTTTVVALLVGVLLPAVIVYRRWATWQAAVVLGACGALLLGATPAGPFVHHQARQFQRSYQDENAQKIHKTIKPAKKVAG